MNADWLLLAATQPTGNATLRMRLWREVRALGAALLRDGLYLLPAGEASRTAFAELAASLTAAGGQAEVIAARADARQAQQWTGLFDRSSEWSELLAEVARCARGAAVRPLPALRAQLRRLHQQAEAIARTDHFPGAAQAQLRNALSDLDRLLERRMNPGEPGASTAALRMRERSDYHGRQWVTRERLWIDRVASAWLIRRFIDPQARFLWLARPADKPKRAIGFDYDGAEFTHAQGRVTFEVLRDSFGLADDPALLRLGATVHALDLEGVRTAEARAVEDLMRGLRATQADDDGFLAAASVALDGWYAAYVATDEDEAPASRDRTGSRQTARQAAQRSAQPSAQQRAQRGARKPRAASEVRR